MVFQAVQGMARDVPTAGATGAGRADVSDRARRLGRPAGRIGLAAGALCLATACSGAASSAPPAAGATTPAQPSSPASSQPAASPTASPASASGTVTGAAATSAQVAAITAAAQGHCGFTGAADILTTVRVTNNGWASAAITARNPQDQGNSTMIFRLATNWTYDTCGSDFIGSGIPDDVLRALGPG